MLDKDFWRKYFKVYDILNLVIPYQELLEDIVKETKVAKGDFILEAGVGTGNLALRLEKEGAQIIGLDFSPEALERYRNKNSNARIVLADLREKLPFNNNTFDKIVSNNVLYNISPDKRIEVMHEFYRILKSRGKIIISNLINGYNPFIIYTSHIRKQINKKGLFYTFREIIKLIIPTIKMFYYNFLLKKEYKDSKFFNFDEQAELLRNSGFIDISSSRKVFANQGIINSARKP